jgi:chemotaxis signal transduction protein
MTKSTAQSREKLDLSYVAFCLGERLRLAIVQAQVQEALDLTLYPLSEVPGVPPFLSGILHWRGQFLWTLDLGILMKHWDPRFSQSYGPWQEGLVVKSTSGHPFVLLIQEREGILRTPILKPIPSRRHPLFPSWIPTSNGRHRVVLDLDALIRMIRSSYGESGESQ